MNDFDKLILRDSTGCSFARFPGLLLLPLHLGFPPLLGRNRQASLCSFFGESQLLLVSQFELLDLLSCPLVLFRIRIVKLLLFLLHIISLRFIHSIPLLSRFQLFLCGLPLSLCLVFFLPPSLLFFWGRRSLLLFFCPIFRSLPLFLHLHGIIPC